MPTLFPYQLNRCSWYRHKGKANYLSCRLTSGVRILLQQTLQLNSSLALFASLQMSRDMTKPTK